MPFFVREVRELFFEVVNEVPFDGTFHQVGGWEKREKKKERKGERGWKRKVRKEDGKTKKNKINPQIDKEKEKKKMKPYQ